MKAKPSGKIITFYSYKGGTGRSMILANIAWILASNRKRVLAVDWDLEAPGLHRYFHPFLLDKELTSSRGVIDFVIDFAVEAMTPIEKGERLPEDWYISHANIMRYAVSLEWEFPKGGWLDFVPAGQQGPTYATRVNSFDWQNFYDRLGGGAFLEAAKEQMRSEYDYILIDSRTGVSDTSGICTVQLPDILVVCYILNNQSITGAAAVAGSVQQQREDIRIFPVPSRVDPSEHDKLIAGLRLAREMFAPFLEHLPPRQRNEYRGAVEVPYIPYYAYEEILATFGDEPGRVNTILSSGERLVKYLTDGKVREMEQIPEALREEFLRQYSREVETPTQVPAKVKRDVTPEVCPYLGLRPFYEEHAPFFFGREAFVQRLVEATRKGRLLVVVGPSGSGKSSTVQAGLVPALRAGALPGSATWPIIIVRPGDRPFMSVAASLLSLLEPASEQSIPLAEAQLADALSKGTIHLRDVAKLVLTQQSGADRLLLVVDQFEELYTLCPDENLCRRFVDQLLETTADGLVTVVLTLRADFYSQVLAYRPLADRLEGAVVNLGPMTREELRQVIEEPARTVGLAFEAGLVERILEDVWEEPGSLPLLQFALTELWGQRRDGLLTHAAYEEIGGVAGAIAQRAEMEYSTLTSEQQAVARRILVRLVRPGEGTEDTRRRARVSELIPSPDLASAVNTVVQRLADARLVVTAQDESSGEKTVELAHEALILGWIRLRRWIDEDRAALRIHRRLTEAALEWERNNRDEGYLYRGARLTEAETWTGAHAEDLNVLERVFLQASIETRETERVASRRRVQMVVAGLVTAIVITSLLAIFAFQQRNRALATLQEVRVANQAAVTSYSSDGVRLVTVSSDGTARLWDASTGAEIVVLGGPETTITWTTFSPDARWVVTGSEDGQVRLWDAATGEEIAVFTGHTDSVRKAVFSSDVSLLATASDDGTGRIWDAETGAPVAILSGHDGPVIDIEFSPDGSRVTTSGTDGTTRVWDAASGELIELLIEPPPQI